MTAVFEEQGCDIEFVQKRTSTEWDELLEQKYTSVLEQLKIIDNHNDLSCTRIWCVREAMIKSFGLVPLDIRIEKLMKKGIVFRVLTGNHENNMVLTFPLEFLPANIAVAAMVISVRNEEGEADHQPTSGNNNAAARYNKDSGIFTDVFLTTFRDCRGFYGKTHFTSFIEWMGGLRELVLAPIGHLLLKDLGSGEYGMVTNTSHINIRHEAVTLDEITGNLRITDHSDLSNSLIDLKFEFYKKEKEKSILLADCGISTTWVKIEDRGLVKKSPIPGYFMEFLKNHVVTTPDIIDTVSKGYPVTTDMGDLVYQTGNLLRPEFIITERTFATGLTHGNTVGNLYYSNYYMWQSEMIEEYLYRHVPGIMTGGGKGGEFLTLHCAVNHLQEAMPFEIISVNMYLQECYNNGLKVYFEYFSKNGKTKRKLAFGSNTIIYCRRINESAIPVVHELPEQLVQALIYVIA